MKRFPLICALIAVVSLGLSSCSEDPAPTPAPEVPEPAEPTIVWEGNESFSVMDLSASMNVSVTVTAEAGISDFLLSIDSDVLESTLGSIYGITVFDDIDLINDDIASGFFGAFGFPSGASLIGATEVSFDLSTLLPMVILLEPEAGSYHNFTVEVTDMEDRSVSRTLSFRYTGE